MTGYGASRWLMPAIGAGMVAVGSAMFGTGYYLGTATFPKINLSGMQQGVNEQRLLLEDTQRQVQANLDALTQRIGLLQAHVTRLDALGAKLVSVNKINTKEFNFVKSPPMGGPADEFSVVGYESDEINRALEKLELALMEKEQQLRVLDQMMLTAKVERSILPHSMPVSDGYITSGYGYRSDPFTGRRQFHKGVDFAGAYGSPILAAAGGKVIKAEHHPEYGKMVEVDHGNGYITRYGHASELQVKTGDVVKKGQQIAKMGSTGRSTGVHLHFEVIKEDDYINPLALLKTQDR